ncbi:MAG: NAD(P)/FAD-dependent oxidoreductase [Xanthomonadales bacterium]
MAIEKSDRITIVGAGMAGTLLAILLARRGFRIDLFEQHPDPRSGDGCVQLCSNLALGERARHALRVTGLLRQVDALSTPMRGRLIHDRAGNVTEQPYGYRAYETLYSVRRESLQQCLLFEAALHPEIRVHFGHRLRSVDWAGKVAEFTHNGDASVHRQPFDVLIGADGAGSRVRRALQDGFDIEVREEMLDAGYKYLSVPTDHDGEPVMNPHLLHVWPRGGYMLLAFPGPDGSFTATLFLPLQGDHRMAWGFRELDSWTRQSAFMDANFPDITPRMPGLRGEFEEHKIGLMGTVHCQAWHAGGTALLIGDAAHCIVPFHGQGVNAALEDCTMLDEILDGGPENWETAFRTLEERRRPDTEAIAQMALDAYHTMRESVRHRDFLLRKALERELEIRHPERFVARYSLVMFHRIPYTEAWDRGRAQGAILDELLRGKTELTEVDLSKAARLIDARLTEVRTP